MPADRSTERPADPVELLVGGLAHAGWQRYEIDSSLLLAADAWNVSLSANELAVPAALKPGAEVKVRVGGETVLVGLVDDVDHQVARGEHRLQLTGRDSAGILVDCSAPIFTQQQMTLQQIIDKVVKPLLPDVRARVDAERQLLRDRVVTEPGDTAWDMLQRAAEANGLWPWFEPDGSLVVGGPRYDTEPVGTLTLRRDGMGNNLLSLAEKRSQADRYSEITVLGQRGAFGNHSARHDVKRTVFDKGVTRYRPKIVCDFEATNEEIAAARGSKLISDGALRGHDLRAVVSGHRAPNGQLWAAGQRVRVLSEPHGLDGIYFVISRRISGDRMRGPITDLTLKADGAWALYAHPSKRKHRRGKNSVPLQIIDGTTGVGR